MQIVLRASFVFLLLLVFMRVLRKRSLGEMSPLQMIVLMTIGDLVQQGVTQEDYSLSGAVLAIGTFGLWITALDWTSWRSDRLRRLIEGEPMAVIENGEPVEKTLNLEWIPWDEVLEAARQQGIDDISKIKLGVLEVDGKLSFVTKQQR